MVTGKITDGASVLFGTYFNLRRLKMKKIFIYIIAIVLMMLITACQERSLTAVVEEAVNTIEMRIRPDTNKGMEKIGNAPIGALIYHSGTVNSDYDSLSYDGVWGNQMIIPINATGGRKFIKFYYKVSATDTPTFFLPNLAARVIHSTKDDSKDTTFVELKHIVPSDTLITDPTGYQAHFYYELRTEFDIIYTQQGVNIDPLTNTGPLISTKIEYSGIPDPNLNWNGVNMSQYNELNVIVSPGEQLYVISSYNGLRGDRRLPMPYNTTTGKWEFEFMYPRNAGINFRVEKASSQALFMGLRLITELGLVSCCNIHYFPDSAGNNVWMLFQASLVNGLPTIPYPGINQLISILELIINPTTKTIPPIPNPELQTLQIKQQKKI